MLPKDAHLWRAQLGHDLRPEYAGEELIDYFPTAYKPERMKPLRDSAREGRANPKGIPYLYIATDKETAMSEVRPWIGSIISAGCFVRLFVIFRGQEPTDDVRGLTVIEWGLL